MCTLGNEDEKLVFRHISYFVFLNFHVLSFLSSFCIPVFFFFFCHLLRETSLMTIYFY